MLMRCHLWPDREVVPSKCRSDRGWALWFPSLSAIDLRERHLRIRGQEWSVWVAVCAAYILVIQSFAGAFAISASAAPLPPVFFEQVLCAPSGNSALPDEPAPKRHNLPDCCLASCPMFQPGLLSEVDTGHVPGNIASDGTIYGAVEKERIFFFRQKSPANPRAPPLQA
jgi:hypothetical protein